MRYIWECPSQHHTEVDRKVVDIEIGPEDGCEVCKSKDLKRVILLKESGVKGFILEGGGWFAGAGYRSTRNDKK